MLLMNDAGWTVLLKVCRRWGLLLVVGMMLHKRKNLLARMHQPGMDVEYPAGKKQVSSVKFGTLLFARGHGESYRPLRLAKISRCVIM